MDYGSAVRASRPRRLSSLGFGKDAIDLSVLRSYYLGDDLMHLSKEKRADEVLKRSRKLMIDGVSFALPRVLKKEIYYDKVYKKDRFDEQTKKWIPVYTYTPCEIYRVALARERMRNSKAFDGLSRKDPCKDSYEVDYNRISRAQMVEKNLYESRSEIAEKRLQSNKQRDSF